MAPGRLLPDEASSSEDLGPSSSSSSSHGCIVTSIPSVPVTVERKPFIPSAERKSVLHPGVPRANIAPTFERPEGTTEGNWAEEHKEQTVLQQHFDFFCLTEPGVIYPWDTYNGFRKLGYNLLVTSLAVFIIHLNFSYPTQPPSRFLLPLPLPLPDPFFRIYLALAHKAKHGSDSGVFDNEGRFVPQKFEDLFDKYCERAGKERRVEGAHQEEEEEGLTIWDVSRMLKGQRLVMDPIGWGGGVFEWGITYILLWPEDGIMRKEDIRRVIDGSIFHEIAARRERKLKLEATEREALKVKRTT